MSAGDLTAVNYHVFFCADYSASIVAFTLPVIRQTICLSKVKL